MHKITRISWVDKVKGLGVEIILKQKVRATNYGAQMTRAHAGREGRPS